MFKVICVKSHSQGLVKEGVIYPVYNEEKCKCGLNYDVGIKLNVMLTRCSDCGYLHAGYTHWICSELFVPIDETFAEEVLEQIKEQINEEELVKI